MFLPLKAHEVAYVVGICSDKVLVSYLFYRKKILLQFWNVEDAMDMLQFPHIIELIVDVDVIDSLALESFTINNYHRPLLLKYYF